MLPETAHHDHTHPGSVFSSLWDKLGIIASGLCLVDCVVLPIVSTALLSVQSSFVWAKSLHWFILPVIGVTASMAFYHSYKVHRSYRIVAAGLAGFLLLLAGEVFEKSFSTYTINWVSITGSVFLIGAHLKNLLLHMGKGSHTCDIDHGAGGRQLFGRQNATAVNAAVYQAQSAQVP